MNPLAKAIGTALVLAAGTLGASMQETPFGLPIGFPGTSPDGADGLGNETSGNGTSQGNGTSGNQTSGNQTAPDGNKTTPGNKTAPGNETADGNATAEPGPEADPEVRAAVCSFDLRESGSDLSPGHHEWGWLVTPDVQRVRASFWGERGIPTGLSSHADVRLVDGSGRTLAHASGDGILDVVLERGVDAMADGAWRLTYDTGDAFAGYHIQVSLDCGG